MGPKPAKTCHSRLLRSALYHIQASQARLVRIVVWVNASFPRANRFAKERGRPDFALTGSLKRYETSQPPMTTREVVTATEEATEDTNHNARSELPDALKTRRDPHISKRRGSRPRLRRDGDNSPPWIDYELDSQENVDRFIRDAIKETWTGQLGTRQTNSINGLIRLLLESRGWIQKTPLPLIQAHAVLPPKTFTLDEMAHLLEALPIEAHDAFFRRLRERRVKAGSTASSSGR